MVCCESGFTTIFAGVEQDSVERDFASVGDLPLHLVGVDEGHLLFEDTSGATTTSSASARPFWMTEMSLSGIAPSR